MVRFGLALALTLPAGIAQAGQYPKLSRSDLETLQESFADLAGQVLPTAVAIRTYIGRTLNGGSRVTRPYSQGSGFVLRPDGYILTNYHVIEDAPIITVILHSGVEMQAQVVQFDKRSDLAVIKIEAAGLPAARLANVNTVRLGHWVFAVGNPYGLSNLDGALSFTVGNVSSVGRNMTHRLDPTETRYYGNLIETSAAINPGNSGGPLFNLNGQVIGVVTAIESRSGGNEGVGFAIPISDRTLAIIDKLVAGEKVRYGFLGVTVSDGEPRTPVRTDSGLPPTPRGALVEGLTTEGPADRAGIRAGDVLVEFDGTVLEDSDHLVRVVGSTPIGARVSVRYLRNGHSGLAYVTLGDRDAQLASQDAAADRPYETSGTTLTWRGAVLVERQPLPPPADENDKHYTVVVAEVQPRSEAASRGLKVDDVIVELNGAPVHSLADFQKAQARAQGTIRLRLQDDRVIQFRGKYPFPGR